MFSKRLIGTNAKLKIHEHSFTAKGVATHILRHLKTCAEQALGYAVQRAVITHPAYFDPNQVEETREAAMAAGFDMELSEQMMMEPTAAALAYTADEKKDPLRVMTYDLGGGTFDVTVLERREGIITVRAFDGDHLLGGYNFDRELVQWILNKLKKKGRVIPYDEENPEDRGRRARLLQLAENIKIRLYDQKSDKVFVTFKAPDILLDADGKKVQILERINREQYAALLAEHLQETINCCHKALAKAKLEIKDLDTLLLVGSSTYGQWVIEAVNKAFDQDVQPYNPDICIAAGAAISAAALPPVFRSADLELVLDVPKSSALPSINVTGKLKASTDSSAKQLNFDTLKVQLFPPGNSKGQKTQLSEDGYFLFEDIDLLADQVSDFRLEVIDKKGTQQLTTIFSVNYGDGSDVPPEIYTVLPKPIYLSTASGMKLIAGEGVTLPASCKIELRRLQDDSEVDIEIFQEQDLISKITVKDIPEDTGRNSKVELEVEITQHNHMKGLVTIKNQKDQVARTSEVNISFPPMILPDLPTLAADFEILEEKRQQLESLSNDPVQRILLGGKGKKISKKIRKLFEEQSPDKQEIHKALKTLKDIVEPPRDDMNPTRSLFRQLLDDCRDMISKGGGDPQLQAFKAPLGEIEKDGNDAYTTKNHKKWATVNENLNRLHHQILKLNTDGSGESKLPPTVILKDQAQQEVDQLRTKLRTKRESCEHSARYFTKYKGRADKIEKKIDLMDVEIDKVDDALEPSQGLAQVQMALRSSVEVEKDIPCITHDV